jgi:hypothetical protein
VDVYGHTTAIYLPVFGYFANSAKKITFGLKKGKSALVKWFESAGYRKPIMANPAIARQAKKNDRKYFPGGIKFYIHTVQHSAVGRVGTRYRKYSLSASPPPVK